MRHSQGHEHQSQPHIGGLKLLKDCPVCTGGFQPTDVQVVDTYQNVHLLHVTCSSCSHALISLFAVSHAGMSSVGMTTDLSADDASRVLNTEPITDDEVLQFHAVLSGRAQGVGSIEDLFITHVEKV